MLGQTNSTWSNHARRQRALSGELHARTNCGAACVSCGACHGATSAGAGRQEAACRRTPWAQAALDPDGQQGSRDRRRGVRQEAGRAHPEGDRLFQSDERDQGLVRADQRRQQAPARQVLRQAARPVPLRLQSAQPAGDPVRRQVHGHPGPRPEDRRPRRVWTRRRSGSFCARTSTCCGTPASSRCRRSTT